MLASAAAAAAAAEAGRAVEGRVDGNSTGEPVWIGLFVGDATTGSWTRADGGRFELVLPVDDQATLLFLSKDRVSQQFVVVGHGADETVAVPAGERPTLPTVSEDRLPKKMTAAEDGSLEALAVRLAPGHALAGTVRSEGGPPLADVAITVEARDRAGHGLEVPSFATPRWRTDRDGAFVVEGLEGGSNTLTFARDGVPVLVRDVWIRSDVEPNRINIELAPGHFISGRVVDSDGASLGDATVETQSWIVARTTTDRDGSFRLGPFRRSTHAVVRAHSPMLGTSLHHEVHAPLEGIVLELRRYMLLGQVVHATTAEPVRSFQLMILREGEKPWHRIETEDGFFQVPLEDKTYAVVISAEGHPPWYARLPPSESDNYDLGVIALAPERSISGRVVDALTGAPIEGVTVRLGSREHDDDAWRMFAVNWLDGAQTDADGGFSLSALPLEGASIAAFAHDYQRKTVYLPPEVRHLDIALDPRVPGATISGSLTLPDGTPVAGVVTLASPNSEYARHTLYNKDATTNENGAFHLTGLQDGAYDLVAASEAGVVQSRAIVVADGQSLENVKLVVEDGPQVHLSLAGLRSKAEVSIYDRSRRKVYEWRFGNGAHPIQSLPGEATLVAQTWLGNSSRRLVERMRLEQGQEADITFDFSHDSRLSGTVTAGGQPVGGIYLQVVPANPSMPVGSTETTRHGRYDVWGLSPGRHIVRTRAGQSFEVDIARQTSFDIELPRISVSGVVRSAQSMGPIGLAYVRLRGSNGYRKGALTAADGTFHFQGLSAGEYMIRASQRGFEDRSQGLLVGGEESVTLELEQSTSGEDSAGRG